MYIYASAYKFVCRINVNKGRGEERRVVRKMSHKDKDTFIHYKAGAQLIMWVCAFLKFLNF